MKLPEKFIYKNIANIISILGVLPLCILFMDGGYQYLIPLFIYNNIMDDLDGILAVELNIESEFGAIMDNVCDAISHVVFVMVVGMHYGGACAIFSLASAAAIILRVVFRLSPKTVSVAGSPTNELIRHVLFILLLADIFTFSPASILIVVFALHAASMLIPFKMRYLIRNMTKSTTAISLVNVALLVAWLVPSTTLIIASCFIVTYLFSFVVGGIMWLGKET